MLIWIIIFLLMGFATYTAFDWKKLWAWLNPRDFSQGIIDGDRQRAEEAVKERARIDAEHALADAEIRRKAHNRNIENIRKGIQPLPVEFMPHSRPGLHLTSRQDINTNTRKITATDDKTHQTVTVTLGPEDLAKCKTPHEQQLMVAMKIEKAIALVTRSNPVLGEVAGGVSVTPKEYEKKHKVNGQKPLSPEDELVARILGASDAFGKAEDYTASKARVDEAVKGVEAIKKDAEYEAGH